MVTIDVEYGLDGIKYEVEGADINRLRNTFTYHPPKDDQAERYQQIRQFAFQFANLILNQTPKSREQSLALTHLEEAVFWANAAIARNE